MGMVGGNMDNLACKITERDTGTPDIRERWQRDYWTIRRINSSAMELSREKAREIREERTKLGLD